jgi:hypothetical protein
MAPAKIDDMLADGATRAEIEALPALPLSPPMAPEAYQGIAGRIVRAIEPHSEADPVALLINTLIGAGNMVGPGPYTLVEETAHRCNENAAWVGRTSKARKGQSMSTPRRIFAEVDEAWASKRVRSGLSSGEGLIYNVRDAREEQQPVKEHGRVMDYQIVVVDAGEPDKRLQNLRARVRHDPQADVGREEFP